MGQVRRIKSRSEIYRGIAAWLTELATRPDVRFPMTSSTADILELAESFLQMAMTAAESEFGTQGDSIERRAPPPL